MQICTYCGTEHNQVDHLMEWPCKACSRINFNYSVPVEELPTEEEVIEKEVPDYKTFYDDIEE